ncbi:toprim domain-containing protein [bacterium]|nr:toprim domain-containing protein [bacterium]
MGNCVAKLPHKCGSRAGLQVFEKDDGSVDGYCFSCDTYVKNPFGEPKRVEDIPQKIRIGKTKEEIEAEIAEIANFKTVDLRDRKLRKDALAHFGIKVGLSEQDGVTPRLAYFPYYLDGKLKAYKAKLFENKRFWSVGDQTEVDLFGWEQAIASGAKRIIITEGEFDAVALHRIIDMFTPDKYQDFKPVVCSLPHGSSAAQKDLARLMPKIRKHFKEISLCFDKDEAGQKAIESACIVVPDATVITLPGDDANDCLMKGTGKAAFKATTFNAAKPKNTRLVFGEELHEEAREPARPGELTWPWEHLNKATRGIRYGETIYLGAGVKMGKSELLNALGAHFVKHHKIKVFMAKPEEANKKTYKLMAGKMVGRVFHDPDREFDFDAYDRAGQMLDGKLAMVNLYQHLGWETLKADIYAAAAWGSKAVFIDPITNLTNGIAAADANVKLQEIAQELAAMALDLNIVIFIFCHLKAPAVGNDHEHGGDVLSAQFAGSRAMMRSCNMMLGLQGDKSPDLDPEERNRRDLILLEDREFGNVGKFGLYWDLQTQLFNEMRN